MNCAFKLRQLSACVAVGGGGGRREGAVLVISKNVTRRSGYLVDRQTEMQQQHVLVLVPLCELNFVEKCIHVHRTVNPMKHSHASSRVGAGGWKEHKDRQTDRRMCLHVSAPHPLQLIHISASGGLASLPLATFYFVSATTRRDAAGRGGTRRGWMCVSLLRNILSVAQPSCQAQSIALPPPCHLLPPPFRKA